MSAAPLDHAAMRLAVAGLRLSLERVQQAARGNRTELAMIASVDFVNWACAIDEQLKSGHDYARRQGQAEGGRLVLGIRHVRDRHMHQVVISSDLHARSFFRRFPPQLSGGMRWLPVAQIGESDSSWRRDRPAYVAQRKAYEDHMARRSVPTTLQMAQDWLIAEVRHSRVQIPD